MQERGRACVTNHFPVYSWQKTSYILEIEIEVKNEI